jgi:Uma2 family endonuclease
MSIAEPALRRWTVAEYFRAAEAGVFDPEERLELIEGEIFRMSPQDSPHTTALDLTEDVLREIFRSGYRVRTQKPLAIAADSVPEPDIAVVRGSVRDYAKAHPTTAVLVVEVADSTVWYDRNRKAPLYARAGIPEYWILNLRERALEVHRNPDQLSGKYQEITRCQEEGAISPLAAPTASISIRDLLP